MPTRRLAVSGVAATRRSCARRSFAMLTFIGWTSLLPPGPARLGGASARHNDVTPAICEVFDGNRVAAHTEPGALRRLIFRKSRSRAGAEDRGCQRSFLHRRACLRCAGTTSLGQALVVSCSARSRPGGSHPPGNKADRYPLSPRQV